MGSNLRETPLGCFGESVVQRAGDRELEHAVAEKLEPLVRRAAIRRPGGVRQDVVEARGRQRVDQTP